ncbi:MAG: T9SS type A sorting domain-containing protein, partial [Ignavibacteriales bacterium]|nr:T9SS type A sorting domain-containing protein [Ignavibacteriales bacterium]
NGTLLWTARYNGPVSKKDYAFAIEMDRNNNVYVTGASEGNAKFDYATIKYDVSGNETWVARFNSRDNKNDCAYDLKVDDLGNVYVTGTSEGSTTKYDYSTLKYNSSGVFQWESRYDAGIKKNDIARSIAYNSNSGDVFVTGSSEQGKGRNWDFLTIRIDGTTGNEEWTGRYNGTGYKDDHAYNVAVRPGGSCLAIAGTSVGTSATKIDYAVVQGSAGSALPSPITTPAIYEGDDEVAELPEHFMLYQNFPNPFNPTTVISYQLPVDSWVRLKVYNMLGQEVATLMDEVQDAGYKRVEWNAERLPSGVYFSRMIAGEFKDTKKLILMR